MKKYMILILTTVLCVVGIILFGRVTTAASDVSVYEMKKTTENNTVTASGKLQYSDEIKVTAGNYCIIEESYVTDGDEVKKGDALLKVSVLSENALTEYSSPDIEKLIGVISDNAIPEEIMDQLKQFTEEKTIYAEKDGIVCSVNCKEKEIAGKNSVLMKLCDPGELKIVVRVNEAYIEKIHKGQKAMITFTATGDKQFSGTVSEISDHATQSESYTGKETFVEVTIKPDKTDALLRVGYSAECSIITATDEDLLILPYEYLHSDDKGEYVFIANGNQAMKKYIKTGSEYKNGIAVLKGLRQGDRIITDISGISDGQRILVLPGESHD